MFKLMIADDNPHTLQGLSEDIDWENYNFSLLGTFQNGKQLLDMAKKELPDVVITDISMPVMDGITLSSELYQLKADMIIVFISSYSEFEYTRSALKLRIFDYILKPIELSQIHDIMTRILEKLQKAQMERFLNQEEKYKQERYRKKAIAYYIARLLLQKKEETAIREELQQIGLSVTESTWLYVVSYALDREPDQGDLPNAHKYFHSSLESSLEGIETVSVILENRHGVFLLLMEDRAVSVADLLARIDVDMEAKTRCRMTMGCSNPSTHFSLLPMLYKQSQAALFELLETNAAIPIASYADIHISSESTAPNHPGYSNSKNIAAMRKYIEQHYMDPITTNDVASSVYLSPNYANRCFTAECNITIFGYIVQYRLEKAKELLRNTDEQVTRIAELVGYSTKTSFYIAFKRHTNLSPTEYRRQYANLL